MVFRREQIVGFMVNVICTVGMCLLTVAISFSSTSYLIGLSAATSLITIVLFCPALFIHWQNYKDTIHGPWDEAVPKF